MTSISDQSTLGHHHKIPQILFPTLQLYGPRYDGVTSTVVQRIIWEAQHRCPADLPPRLGWKLDFRDFTNQIPEDNSVPSGKLTVCELENGRT